jgi:N,N-dimethylformamidase
VSDLPIIGYCDPLTVAPGDTVRFMVSSRHADCTARLVRLIHGDPNPRGPGPRSEPVELVAPQTFTGRRQPLHGGSYVHIPDLPVLEEVGSFTVQMWLWPTTPDKGEQGLLCHWDDDGGRGYGVGLAADGSLAVRVGNGNGGREELSTGAPLRAQEWVFVAVTYDAATGEVGLHQAPVRSWPNDPARVNRRATLSVGKAVPQGKPLLLGATLLPTEDGRQRVGCHYNGKLEAPRLFGAVLSPEQLQALAQGTPPAELNAPLVAAWDFSLDMATSRVTDTGPHGIHGWTVQMPARAMTGHGWDGSEINPALRPGQYGAIHFHDDDLVDAGWQPDVELSLPPELPSGVYALHVTGGGDEDTMPFFVRPPRGTAQAKAALLMPTNSYLAYANEKIWLPRYLAPHLPQQEDDAGRNYCRAHGLHSLYDTHSDGSGVCYSSRLRPIVNLKPQAHCWFLKSPHQFAADLHLVDWLHSMGFAHDIITDEALHAEGQGLLEPYRVVLTGSHPEYWSGAMLDALEGYQAGGGRLMYLGGNGFYWVTAVAPDAPHVIEVRRFAGVRAWHAGAGEYHLSTTGELGGLWRDRGRAPNRVAGVGFTAQGFDRGSPYARMPDSHDPRAAWIFEGIGEEEPIGDHPNLVLEHGAAGFEVDRLDRRLGTPFHALHLARSGGYSDSYQHTVEEVLTANSRQGGTVNSRVRADMVYYEGPNDGAVFSTGSISWCGALSHNEYDNTVSRVTANVLTRFLREGPLT